MAKYSKLEMLITIIAGFLCCNINRSSLPENSKSKVTYLNLWDLDLTNMESSHDCQN